MIILKLAIIAQTFFVFYPLYYGWEGGVIRSGISTIFISIILFICIARGAVKGQLTIPRVKIIPFLGFLAFILVSGSAVGFLHGYPTKAILSDLFPILEFIAYFLVGLMLIKTADQAKHLVRLLIAIIGFVAWIEVIIYLVHPQFYFHQTLISGLVIKRVVDFTTPIGLLLLLSTMTSGHKTFISYTLGVGMLMAILLSFLKSIWIALPLTLLMVTLLHRQRRQFIKKTAVLLGFLAVGLLLAAPVFSLFVQHPAPFDLSHMPSLMSGLLGQLFDSTIESYERWQYVGFVRDQIEESPISLIIGKGLGAGWWTSIGETRLAAEQPAQRWRTDVPSYPLFVAWKLGLTGVLIFGIIFVLLTRSSFYMLNALRDQFFSGFSAGMLGVYTYVFLVSAIAFTPFIHFPLPFYLGTTSAILCMLPRFYRSEQNGAG